MTDGEPTTATRSGYGVALALALGPAAELACVIAVPAALSCDERPVPAGRGGRWPAARLGPLLACNVLFGVGYIGYFTFIVCAGSLPPLLSRSLVAAIASAALFGSSVVALVAAVMAVARRSLLPVHWASAITWLTVGFAAGQCLGPVLAGLLADRPAGLEAGLYASAGVLAIGSLVALTQRHVEAATAVWAPSCRSRRKANNSFGPNPLPR